MVSNKSNKILTKHCISHDALITSIFSRLNEIVKEIFWLNDYIILFIYIILYYIILKTIIFTYQKNFWNKQQVKDQEDQLF